jgi:hypothetical protein
MIQSLRTVHRRAFVGMAVLLPAVLAVGIGARRPNLRNESLASQLSGSFRLLKSSDAVWRKHAIQTQFYADSTSPSQIYVVLRPAKELNEPDLLLYWTDSTVQGNALPASAELLGVFGTGKALALPQQTGLGNSLVLYSLAHQAVVDSATLEHLR